MMRESPVPAPKLSLGRRIAHLAWRALKLEALGYLSILRFILRRKGVPPGGKPFTYHGPSMAALVVFIAVSAIEIIVVDLLVRQWSTARIVMLVIGIWGLVYVLGLLFGFLTRPHVITPDTLTLRRGPEVSWIIDWNRVDVVSKHKFSTNGEKGHWLTTDSDGRETLNLWSNGEANISLKLDRAQEFALPGRRVSASRVRFYTDNPTEFMDAVRPILAPVDEKTY